MKNLVVYEVYHEKHPDPTADELVRNAYDTITVKYKSCLSGMVSVGVFYVDAKSHYQAFLKGDNSMLEDSFKRHLVNRYKVPEEELVLLKVGKL